MLYWICNATFHPNYEEILHFANVTFCQTLIFTQTTKENIQFTLILSYTNTNCQDFYLKSYNLPNLNICKNVCKSHNLHTFCLKLARHATICLIYNENPTFYQTCYTCFPPFCDIMPNFQQQFRDIMPNFQQFLTLSLFSTILWHYAKLSTPVLWHYAKLSTPVLWHYA